MWEDGADHQRVSIVTFWITTFLSGRSFWSRGTAAIASTTSSPEDAPEDRVLVVEARVVLLHDEELDEPLLISFQAAVETMPRTC